MSEFPSLNEQEKWLLLHLNDAAQTTSKSPNVEVTSWTWEPEKQPKKNSPEGLLAHFSNYREFFIAAGNLRDLGLAEGASGVGPPNAVNAGEHKTIIWITTKGAQCARHLRNPDLIEEWVQWFRHNSWGARLFICFILLGSAGGLISFIIEVVSFLSGLQE